MVRNLTATPVVRCAGTIQRCNGTSSRCHVTSKARRLGEPLRSGRKCCQWHIHQSVRWRQTLITDFFCQGLAKGVACQQAVPRRTTPHPWNPHLLYDVLLARGRRLDAFQMMDQEEIREQRRRHGNEGTCVAEAEEAGS